VFMLPLFGTLSDKCNTKFGKRTPFITLGTIVAAVALVGLSFVDNAQMKNISDVSTIDDPASLAVIYDTQAEASLITPEGEAFVLSDVFTKEEFTQIRSKVIEPETVKEVTNADYTNYVAPARQACASAVTSQNPGTLIAFLGILLLLLISMATFRTPAVALMPDVTLKPLRSKANAIINLTGTAGGIIVLALGSVFATSKNVFMQYTGYVLAVCYVMIAGLYIFFWFVKEKKWAAEMEEETRRLGLEEIVEGENAEEQRKLSRSELISLMLILASVALWYIGYNSITSKYSVYATNILGFDFNLTLIVAQAAAIVAYIPVGIISSKFGRRKTILAGIIMLAAAFLIGHFIQPTTPAWIMFPIFSLAGIGWATINVNSFPMVVELAKGGNVGKYTGYYYTASMSAQIVAPIVSGVLYDLIGMRQVFFLFGAAFVIFSFITMFFVKHGDAKPAPKKSVLENLDVDD